MNKKPGMFKSTSEMIGTFLILIGFSIIIGILIYVILGWLTLV